MLRFLNCAVACTSHPEPVRLFPTPGTYKFPCVSEPLLELIVARAAMEAPDTSPSPPLTQLCRRLALRETAAFSHSGECVESRPAGSRSRRLRRDRHLAQLASR